MTQHQMSSRAKILRPDTMEMQNHRNETSLNKVYFFVLLLWCFFFFLIWTLNHSNKTSNDFLTAFLSHNCFVCLELDGLTSKLDVKATRIYWIYFSFELLKGGIIGMFIETLSLLEAIDITTFNVNYYLCYLLRDSIIMIINVVFRFLMSANIIIIMVTGRRTKAFIW